MKLLKIGISGVRGIVGDVHDADAGHGFRLGFRHVRRPRSRSSSAGTPGSTAPCSGRPALRPVSPPAATSCDLGVCPTPVLQKAVRAARARGGISITAGHNDIQWNALTFINRDGTYLNPFQGAEVLDLYHLGQVPEGGRGRPRATVFADGAADADAYFHALAASSTSGPSAQRGSRSSSTPATAPGPRSSARFADALGFELDPDQRRAQRLLPPRPGAAAAERPAGRLRPQGRRRRRRIPSEQRRQPRLARLARRARASPRSSPSPSSPTPGSSGIAARS